MADIIFSDLGVAVIVNFTVDTDMAGMFGEGNCSQIISNAAIFGKGNYCVWVTPSTLVIWLGSKAKVEVGNRVKFIPGTIHSADGTVALNIPSSNNPAPRIPSSNIIHGAYYPVIPIPVIVVRISACVMPVSLRNTLQAPYTMSACADLVLDGSRSVGTGGRDMTYTWSVLSGPPKANIIALFLKNLHGPVVLFPSSYVKKTFQEGEEYIFSLSVQNHFHIKSNDPPAYFGVSCLSAIALCFNVRLTLCTGSI